MFGYIRRKHALETEHVHHLYHLVEHTGYHLGQIIDRTQTLTGRIFEFCKHGLNEKHLRDKIEETRKLRNERRTESAWEIGAPEADGNWREWNMPEELTIRNAVLDDLAAIVAIYNSTIPGRMVTADTEPVSVESRLHWFHEHAPERRPLWVAERNGEICGWLSYQSFYGRPAYNGTAEISIYVAEAHRRHGLGRILLQRAIDAAPGIGLHTLLGFIFAHNGPSLQLFQRFGFERWAHLPGVAVLDGIKRDLIIVGKQLSD